MLVAIDKCLARTPDIRVSMMYGIAMWGLEGGWKQIDNILNTFCKVTLGMP
jgi:hypothetical protein